MRPRRITPHHFAPSKGFIDLPAYRRPQPESTLRHRLVAEHYPRFRDRRAVEGRPLQGYVKAEFEPYLKCGQLEHGFLRVRIGAESQS